MKYIISFFFLYTTLFADIIHINNTTTDISILQNTSFFLDKGSHKSPQTLLSLDTKTFTNIHNNFVNKGYMPSDTLWIKFTVKNDTDQEELKYLVFDNPNIDILNLYYQQEGKIVQLQNGIFHRKHFSKELAFNFPLSLMPYQEQSYLLEIRAITHSMHFSLFIKNYKAFKDDDTQQQLVLSAFFAILFVIIFYNSVIYLYSKEKIYLYYALFVTTMFIHHLSLKGMIAYFTPPNLIIPQAYMPPYYMALVMLSVVLFTSVFLNLHRYKKIFIGIKIIIAYVFLIIVFNSQNRYLLHYLTPAAFIEVVYLEIVGAYLYLSQKEKYAKYFFFIWSVSLVGILVTISYYEGLYAHPIPFVMEITFASETLLFSIVLSSYIKDLQVEKLAQENLLLEQSKMASMGSMLQNIAHQYRQPLAEINAIVMKIDADLYEKQLTSQSLKNDLHAIETLTTHLSNTIEGLTSYSRQTKHVQTTSFEEALQRALQIMGSLLHDVTLKIDVQKNLQRTFNLNEIVQVILVILNNAIDAFTDKQIQHKIITITIFQDENNSIMSIEDNAGGIKNKDLLRVFEPYFSTKFKSQGVGIGLYMAKAIIESYNGKLSVCNTKHGAQFTILL